MGAMDLNMQTGNSSFLLPHTYPGRLIAAEGLDGSGKSTQLHLLSFWLRAEGYEVILAEWTSSRLIKRALKAGRKQGISDPKLLSLLHAADIAEIHQRDIVPALARGALVLADRYIYTALARDLARGVELEWAQHVYQFATRPDLGIYFQISAEEALHRSLSTHPLIKYEQRAGMEHSVPAHSIDNFRSFQQRVLHSYEMMGTGFAFLYLDAMLPVKQQQQQLRDAVQHILPGD
ncbi:MAG: thymidylate kinase [Ktedonobacteraceae bacterium]|nr:thymidylate kinase [Ktedonobacteraceae bacterium]